MNNDFKTPNIYAKTVMMNLGGALNVCRNMSHSVTPEFKTKVNGNKPGATIMVRRPYRFTVSDQLVYDPQPLTDTAMPVTISKVAQIGYDWDAIEKTLSLREMNELYAKPAALALASKINAAAATFCADNTFNSVGTPGVAPTDDSAYLAAGDLIVAQGLPENEELKLIINRRMSSAFVHGTKTLFNKAGSISAQWEKGTMVDSLGYSVSRDQTINTHTVGTYSGTPVVNGANQSAEGGNNATMTLNTNGWGSGVSTLNRGDKFVIGSATVALNAGVFSVHPQTRQSTGYQQQFTVVNTISDTTGTINMVVYPAITNFGQYQNVDSTPVASALITVTGTTGAVAQQGLLMHKNAFAFVSVPINGPADGMGAVVTHTTDDETGISLQLTKAFDTINHREINKILVLYDFAKLYPEMACVIQA